MTGAAGAAAPAAADFIADLQPLDWIVIAAAAVCLIVLVRELHGGRGLFAPVPEE